MDIAAAQCIALKMCSTILEKVRQMSSVMSNAWALHTAWHATWGDWFTFPRSAKLRMFGPRAKPIRCCATHFQSLWNQPHCHLRRGHRTSSIVDFVVAASCNCCNCCFFFGLGVDVPQHCGIPWLLCFSFARGHDFKFSFPCEKSYVAATLYLRPDVVD